MICDKCNAEMKCEHVGANETKWECIVCPPAENPPAPKPETPKPIEQPDNAPWVFLLMLVMIPYVLFKDWMMRLRKGGQS